MKWLLRLLLGAAGVTLWSNVLPGIELDSFLTAVLVVIALAIVNLVIRPILLLLTLPITLLSLGLFLLVINVILIQIVDFFVPGFKIDGFWSALLFGFLVAITNTAIERALEDEKA